MVRKYKKYEIEGGVGFDYKTKHTKNRTCIDLPYHGNWHFKRMQWKQPARITP